MASSKVRLAWTLAASIALPSGATAAQWKGARPTVRKVSRKLRRFSPFFIQNRNATQAQKISGLRKLRARILLSSLPATLTRRLAKAYIPKAPAPTGAIGLEIPTFHAIELGRLSENQSLYLSQDGVLIAVRDRIVRTSIASDWLFNRVEPVKVGDLALPLVSARAVAAKLKEIEKEGPKMDLEIVSTRHMYTDP